jgi:cell division protein FtsQ
VVATHAEPAASPRKRSDPEAPQSPQPSQQENGAADPLKAAQRDRRKVERDEIRRFTAGSRRRRRAWLIGLGSLLAVGLIIVGIAYSPLMSLRRVDVVGTSRLSAAAVQASIKGQLGTPLPLINFGAVKKDLASFSLIQSYSTETRPPGTLVIRIVERQPVGVLQTAQGFQLVDQAGIVISTTPDKPGGYPIIVTAGKGAAAKTSFASSAAVLAALPQSVLPQVASITATTEDNVTLTLTGGKTVVWGSAQQSDLKAADLSALLKAAPDAGSYDVSSPESPVTG